VPRASKPTDPWSTFVDLFADTLAARLDFPPRASSATPALAAPPPVQARPKRRRRHRHTALATRLVDELLEALATRLDFPPRASSAASALNPSPAEGAPASDPARRKEKRRVPARSAGVRRNIRRNPS
jgi:hypothetical protein